MFERPRAWLGGPLRSLSLGIVAALVSASCAPAGTAAGNAQATAGGQQSLTVYTALEDDQLPRYLPVFQKAYPNIKLNVVRESTGIITAKFLAEKANPQADVIWGVAATSLLVAAKEGLLEPYAPAGLQRVDARFRDSANPPRWVGIDVWEAAFCVNEVEIKKKGLPMPASWADLTQPAYRGQIVMPNPAASGTGYLNSSGWLQAMGEDAGWRFMDALHGNVAQYVPSGSKPCKMAGAGEFPIGVSFGYRAVVQRQAGEPVAAVWPKEGSGWDLEANALVKKPQINPAAKTFLDWAITDPIMAEYAKSYPITTVKTGASIPDGYLKEPLKQLIKNDLEWAAVNRDRILKEWAKRYEGKVVK